MFQMLVVSVCWLICAGVSGADAWTPTGSMSGPRAFHSAILLDDGSVLVWAGSRTAPG